MRILFLSRWLPYPPDNGSRIRIYNILRCLSSAFEVHLLSFSDGIPTKKQIDGLAQVCKGVGTVIYSPFQPVQWKSIVGFFSPLPRSIVATYSGEMEDLIHQALKTYDFDVVIATEIDMARYAENLPIHTKILEELEITNYYSDYHTERSLSKRLRKGLTWYKLQQYTRSLLKNFNGVTVVSSNELDRLQNLSSTHCSIRVISNGVDTTGITRNANIELEEDSLIYSGAMTYSANFDAVAYFLDEIFPLIRAKRPGVCLYITGKTDGVPIDQFSKLDGVIFTGYLPDIMPRLKRSWANVVPLRKGGGTRLKILEALAAGVPVISTRKGAEGLDLIAGRDLIIADSPEEFANQVIKVLASRPLRDKLSEAGRLAVERKYDWQPIVQDLLSFINTVHLENH